MGLGNIVNTSTCMTSWPSYCGYYNGSLLSSDVLNSNVKLLIYFDIFVNWKLSWVNVIWIQLTQESKSFTVAIFRGVSSVVVGKVVKYY